MSLLDHPSLLGFEPLYSHLDFLSKQRGGDAYPPYDVLVKGNNTFIIRIAVAGFTKDDLRLIAQPHQLLVIGKRGEAKDDAQEGDYFHNGIAFRAFQRRFALGPGLTVSTATVSDGIIEVILERPELREAGVEIEVVDRGA
jgi:molecular chaperone IbpA